VCGFVQHADGGIVCGPKRQLNGDEGAAAMLKWTLCQFQDLGSAE
jgi:hypothetical protein